jgi:aspartyl-tRNA(Asn)/glutamyl-tRNA(Gln) amidotransferase subunit C
MKITRNEMEYVADLARLSLEDEEVNALTSDMDAILAFVE